MPYFIGFTITVSFFAEFECRGFLELLRGHSLSTFPPVTKLKQEAVLNKNSAHKITTPNIPTDFIIHKYRSVKFQTCFTIKEIVCIIHTRGMLVCIPFFRTFNHQAIVMKHFFLFILFGVSSSCLFSQKMDSAKIYSNIHGIRQENSTFYEAEGYTIFKETINETFDSKGINRIKSKYNINSSRVPTNDTVLFACKTIVDVEIRTHFVNQYSIYYLFPTGTDQVIVIGFATMQTREIETEKFLVKAILNNTIPANAYTSSLVDSIKFADRYIQLGSACNWMGVHNVQCPNLGQMNWSEFRRMEKAEEMIKKQMDITANKPIGEFLEMDTVRILFEGMETRALKTKYKIKIPKLIMGGSNVLIIYYVAAEVRGKYVGCVLSYYTDNAKKNKLPPLLSEVMQLKE